MNKFEELLAVAAKLNGPEGCPWDQKQTFFSLQPYVLEEAHEVIEAVDSNDDRKIADELGDLLYTIVFYATLAEKEKRFTIDDVIESIKEKLIRRHPHVFGETQVQDAEEVVQNWEKIKKEEKAHEERKGLLDGIPKTLPLLVRAQKVLKKLRRVKSSLIKESQDSTKGEEQLGTALLELILEAEDKGIDAESALRRTLQSLEEKALDFRE